MKGALLRSLRASLERLGVPAVDLYQIHGPISLRGHAALAEALAAAHQAGLVKAVGVSNYSVKETRAIDAELRKRGLRLATNQIEFSLLRRSPETGGLLAACAELGVVPLAYSPIGQGRLTGKYSAANPPPGKRELLQRTRWRWSTRVVAELRTHRRAARRQDPQPGRAQLDHRQGRGAHPRGQEPGAGRGERRGAGLERRRRRPRRARRGRARPASAASATASGSTADPPTLPRSGDGFGAICTETVPRSPRGGPTEGSVRARASRRCGSRRRARRAPGGRPPDPSPSSPR